jgi:hypothetical protein
MTTISCDCGQVSLEATGTPILTATCFCDSCQEAGRRFEALPGAQPFLDADGGTSVVVYRKDRVRCVGGAQHLEEYRLKPDSPTRRVIATCCGTPLFGDFTKGHWLSLYRRRFGADAPAIEMRMMTNERRAGVILADDVPNHGGYPAKFLGKMILAWIAMGLRRPAGPAARSARPG